MSRALAPVLTAVVALALAPDAIPQEREGTREIVKRAAQTLKQAKRLSFHAEIVFDEEPRTGLLVQLAGAMDVKLRRPDGLWVDYRDDASAKTLWYDAGRMTLLDQAHGVYAQREIAPTVDEALDNAEERLDLTLPLSDLIANDVGDALLEGTVRGTYVGLHDVDGVLCHHLAFLRDDVDWEIWIEDGKVAVPRKLLIRYKQQPGWPQFTAVLMDWKLDPELADDAFAPKLPKDASRVEFIETRRTSP